MSNLQLQLSPLPLPLSQLIVKCKTPAEAIAFIVQLPVGTSKTHLHTQKVSEIRSSKMHKCLLPVWCCVISSLVNNLKLVPGHSRKENKYCSSHEAFQQMHPHNGKKITIAAFIPHASCTHGLTQGWQWESPNRTWLCLDIVAFSPWQKEACIFFTGNSSKIGTSLHSISLANKNIQPYYWS